MAITRLFQTGAETGSTAELTAVTGSITCQTTRKTGAYSYSDGDPYNSFGQINISSTYMLRMGWYYYGNTSQWRDRLAFRNSTTWLAKMRAMTDGSSDFYIPNTTYVGDAPTGNLQSWKHLGISIKLDASSGWIAVWEDGILCFSSTGINTGTSPCDNIIFGHMNALGTVRSYWDDIYIDDITGESGPVAPPIKQFYWLSPNGNGNYSNWTPSSGSGFQCVDEVPPSDSDYISVASAAQKESHAMATQTLGAGQTAVALIPVVRASKSGANEQLKIGTRYSGTDQLSDAKNLPSSAGYLLERQTTKPGGGMWDQTSIDGVEILLESSGSF